jgi:imidazolonepropionase-like amidohydrolase
VIAEINPESKFVDLEENRKNICWLIEKGIPVALSWGNKKEEPVDLFWHIQIFRKYGIMEEDLVKTITINPAFMFGVDSRIGNLTKGTDADILFFRKIEGKPLPVLVKVMIEGKIVDEME